MAETVSSTESITAPSLVGVWIFDPVDPDGSERQYLYAEGREESIDTLGTELQIRGRAYPIIEFDDITLVGLKLTVFVPFGDDHDEAVQALRDFVLNRRALCYRDNRGRLIWAGILPAPSFADGRAGTAVALTLRAIDYTEAV